MSKSGKSAYFRHVFANNFFGTFLKNFFNGFEIGVKSAFFDTHSEFLKKILFALISIFSKLSKKFLLTCLRIYLNNHQRVRASKLLKLLYPSHPI
jgi:hypothetical protein